MLTTQEAVYRFAWEMMMELPLMTEGRQIW